MTFIMNYFISKYFCILKRSNRNISFRILITLAVLFYFGSLVEHWLNNHRQITNDAEREASTIDAHDVDTLLEHSIHFKNKNHENKNGFIIPSHVITI